MGEDLQGQSRYRLALQKEGAQLRATADPFFFVSCRGSYSLLPYRGGKSQQPLSSCIKRPATWLHPLINALTVARGNPTIKMFYLHTTRQIILPRAQEKSCPFLPCLAARGKISLSCNFNQIWNLRSNCIYLSTGHFPRVRKGSAIIPTDRRYFLKGKWPSG